MFEHVSRSVIVATLVTAVASAAPVLTGASLFNATATGDYDNSGVRWTTVGGDSLYNLYFRVGNTWLNSGNGALTALDLDLSEGSYTIDIYGQPGANPAFGNIGLNLFFDGQTVIPQISAVTAFSSPVAPVPNPAGSTVLLNGFSVGSGSGTLSYSGPGNAALLTGFTWNPPNSAIGDVVQPFNNVPGAGADFFGSLTLIVTPEPGSLILLGGAMLALGTLLRR